MTRKVMDISIIIPCYNLEGYIAKCLQSILSQSYAKSEIEIIVVADSCTDNTAAVAEQLLSGVVNYKIIHTTCRRPGLARNVGLDVASGKYVWFIDGDDYLIDNSALELLASTLNSSDASAVYMENFESESPMKDYLAAWHYFYRRDFIGNDRFNTAIKDEDWEFTRRIKGKAKYKEICITDRLYHYTSPREGSIMTEYMNERKKERQSRICKE